MTDINEYQLGDEVIVMTWEDERDYQMGAADVAPGDAVRHTYTVAGIDKCNETLLLVIPYECTWSSFYNVYRKTIMFDEQYKNEKFFIINLDWIVEKVLKKKNDPDGCQCFKCKDFIYMAAPNGEQLNLPENLFICRTCRLNNSVMFLLTEQFKSNSQVVDHETYSC